MSAQRQPWRRASPTARLSPASPPLPETETATEVPESGDARRLQREAMENITSLTRFLEERLADPSDVAVWHRAIGSMTASFKRPSAAGKLSVLHNFGAPPGGRRYDTRIGVQPTSVATPPPR